MADSIRQQIVDAILTRMQTILIVNGYETDLGNNVFEWRTTDLQESELPGLIVRDVSEDVAVRGGNHVCTLNIEVEAKASGTTSATVIRDIIADITKAIGTDINFSNLVQETEPVENESLGFEQKDKKFSGATMRFNCVYVTNAFDPYNLA